MELVKNPKELTAREWAEANRDAAFAKGALLTYFAKEFTGEIPADFQPLAEEALADFVANTIEEKPLLDSRPGSVSTNQLLQFLTFVDAVQETLEGRGWKPVKQAEAGQSEAGVGSGEDVSEVSGS